MERPSARILAQFIRYATVGALAFGIDTLTLYLLVEYAGMYYLAAASLGYLLGILCHYLFSIRWVFDFRRLADWRHEFALFALVGAAGLALNALIIGLLVEQTGLGYLAAKMVAGVLIVLFNFGARKLLLFT
jgi:putative flippase GtrA